jgi:hypothetical protein
LSKIGRGLKKLQLNWDREPYHQLFLVEKYGSAFASRGKKTLGSFYNWRQLSCNFMLCG